MRFSVGIAVSMLVAVSIGVSTFVVHSLWWTTARDNSRMLAAEINSQIANAVRIEVGAQRMMRLITAGTSFIGQEPAEAFFGVGTATSIDRVTVEWPDGTVDDLLGVAANQVLTVGFDSTLIFADGFETGDTSAW